MDSLEQMNSALNQRVMEEVEKRAHDWLVAAKGADWTEMFEAQVRELTALRQEIERLKKERDEQAARIAELEKVYKAPCPECGYAGCVRGRKACDSEIDGLKASLTTQAEAIRVMRDGLLMTAAKLCTHGRAAMVDSQTGEFLEWKLPTCHICKALAECERILGSAE